MSKKIQKINQNNKPNYIKDKPVDLVEMQKEYLQIEFTKPQTIQKFRLGIDKNNNPIVTIDNIMHFMTLVQFNSFVEKIYSVYNKVNNVTTKIDEMK